MTEQTTRQRGSRLAPPQGFTGMTRTELRDWVQEQGQKSFRGDQIFQWIHQHQVCDPAEMNNVPKGLRAALTEHATPALDHHETLTAKDSTKKLLLRTDDGFAIESVLIPMGDYYTQCLSTQVGCRLGCTFCLTARMGLKRHLGAQEIVEQVHLGRAVELGGLPVRNFVFMGMGEPLDNFDELVKACTIMMDDKGLNISSRRITVSTVGLANRIPELGHAVPVNLALSLNGTTDEQRSEIMPINRKYSMADLKQALKDFPLPPRRRITIEYVMLGGFNDSDDDARRLAKFLQGLRVKVNLIPWNPFEEGDNARPSEERIRSFQSILLRSGLATSIRISKGLDIGAACGQLDGVAENI
jgi:23S rRNA (adenine2503-C2)-methyltransferase